MAESVPLVSPQPDPRRPWDARLARWLVTPLKNTWVTPNYLTTLRLLVGIAGAVALTPGTYGWTNLAALLLVLSNFLDHTDGELARISGKSSRIGHLYDLASDALITVLLFVAMGIGVNTTASASGGSPILLGAVSGIAVALIFLLRMRIEGMAGKAGSRQAAFAGFETEDVLYLLPLVTLCNAVASFLTIASIGAPLFAIWVTIDYRRTLRRHPLPSAAVVPSPSSGQANTMLAVRTERLDVPTLRTQFEAQGAFLSLPNFTGSEIAGRLIRAADAATSWVNRNYLPGHKQGGSVSRYTLDQIAPFIGELYRSPLLIELLGRLAGEPLQLSPPEDPHAYALYFYTHPGDHISWHYDTSYYAGRRYTVLLGVIDQSSCRLEYELHTRTAAVAVIPGSVQMAAGDMLFFDGDKLRHRITPLSLGERRVSLTFEYVTDPTMHPWWRFVSNMKDAVAYFGFRQVFRRLNGRAQR